MRGSYRLRKIKEKVILGIRVTSPLASALIIGKLLLRKWKSFMMDPLVLGLTLLVRSW